ncbi:MAG TPA: mannose-1-phosphate guanylyltransferase/mannose-6-phosphate isomerase [Caulobacteraceae bacterium]
MRSAVLSSAAPPITPVLLCGGAGSRLWPLSRHSTPKQFLHLVGERSMLQETALRTADLSAFNRPILVAGAEHGFQVAEQLRQIGMERATILLEPVARNTAAAIAAAVALAAERDPAALILVMPADHVILDAQRFVRDVVQCAPWAAEGYSVLFGVEPTSPASGYGYIRRGLERSQAARLSDVVGFVEKPDTETAARYVADGYLWNSGIFLLSAAGVMEDLRRFEPAVAAAAKGALAAGDADAQFIRLETAHFGASPNISIDHAVMERTDRALVAAVDWRWTDVGAWSTLWDIGEKDDAGNVHVGGCISQGSRNCYLRSEGPAVAVVGLEDTVVVAMPDAVLVASRAAGQDVKAVLASLALTGHPAATDARKVTRPWGHFESIDRGERFQVKRITVNPGQKLSLQKHAHRAEHWVVVDGVADVRVGEVEQRLKENESVYIPIGAVHRLSNPGPGPLRLIEVQSGDYLGEDDIVRLEDVYQRV